MAISGGFPQNPEGDFLAVGVAGQYIYVHPAQFGHSQIICIRCYKKDGKDKILQTIEMFRAIVKSMAKRGESESCMIKTGQIIHNRKIDITTYEGAHDSVIVEGILHDERLVETYRPTGDKHPPVLFTT
jgi:hypothetical protein